MVECRTRPKKVGGKYTICYDEKPKPKPKAKPVAKAKPKPKLKVVDSYSLGDGMSMTTTSLNDSVMKEIFYRILTDYEDNFKTPLIKKRLYNKIMKANAEEMASIIESYFNPNSSKRINYFTQQRFLKDFAYKTLK
jgi:hypothetical protein